MRWNEVQVQVLMVVGVPSFAAGLEGSGERGCGDLIETVMFRLQCCTL